jgi:lysophospholipase L1-like esterase
MTRRAVLGLTVGLTVGLGLLAGIGLLAGPAPPPQPQHRPIPPLAGRPGEPMRLVVLGTSLTAGAAWPDRLGAALNGCADRPVTVLRVARAGAHSGWGRGQAAAVAALRPDLVLIEFTINDADLRDGQGLGTARANHRALIAALGAARPEARLALMTMSPAFGLRGLMRPRLAAHQAQYRDLAAGGAGGGDLGLIDLAPLWAEALTPGRRRALMPDGLHPTDAAVAAVALPAMLAQVAAAVPGCG